MRIPPALVGTLGRYVLNTLLGTVRFEAPEGAPYGPLDGQPVIFSLWHGRLLPLTWFHRHRNVATLISQSGDGEYIARVVEGWGYVPVRGSSSRGGRQGLKALVRAARKGHTLAITPDGPRGPRQTLQHGVLRAAQLSGRPIVPVTAGCSRAWWPGSWDRFCIPKPFSRVVIRYGEPRHVPRDADPDDLARLGSKLEREMNELTREVDAHGGPTR